MPEPWSAPDEKGIRTRVLDVGAASTLRGRRLRRAQPERRADIGIVPADWRDLLIRWVKTGEERRKRDTLLRLAGNERVHIAERLLQALLAGGWIEIEERREAAARWIVTWVTFLDLRELRRRLGVDDGEAARQAWLTESSIALADPRLAAIRASLDQFAPQRALSRLNILRALERWSADKRFGTRRDFALLAAGHTKALSDNDWNWLGQYLDLAQWGIERHAPVLWLRAPLMLLRDNQRLDLQLVDDCIALTARTLGKLTKIEGSITSWRLIENRTSFERAAREHGARDGVLWLPGFAPSWWKETVSHLLKLSPAPAHIACDPDPAGIEIALQAGELWEQCGIGWHPWMMNSDVLAGLAQRRPLSDHDREHLASLTERSLPPEFRNLATWMIEHGEKGEQEGAL
jgi:hypothetical protein